MILSDQSGSVSTSCDNQRCHVTLTNQSESVMGGQWGKDSVTRIVVIGGPC